MNAGDPTKWTYDPDLEQQADTRSIQPDINGRLTWQATPRTSSSFFYTHQPRDVFGDRVVSVRRRRLTTSSLDTSRLITGELDVAGHQPPAARRAPRDATARVLYNSRRGTTTPTASGGQLDRRDRAGRADPRPALSRGGQAAGPTFIFAAMSAPEHLGTAGRRLTYVTGAHALKFGFGNSWGRQELLERDIDSATSYRFNNGVPNQITMRASPVTPLRRPESRAAASSRRTSGR